jgi:hypothetical protein
MTAGAHHVSGCVRRGVGVGRTGPEGRLGHETAAHRVNWTSKSRDVHQTLLD